MVVASRTVPAQILHSDRTLLRAHSPGSDSALRLEGRDGRFGLGRCGGAVTHLVSGQTSPRYPFFCASDLSTNSVLSIQAHHFLHQLASPLDWLATIH